MKVNLYDTAGQERYQNIVSQYYKNADIILIVFDLTNYNSFESIYHWYQEAKDKILLEHTTFCLIGNKDDLINEIAINEEEITSVIEKMDGIKYYTEVQKLVKAMKIC